MAILRIADYVTLSEGVTERTTGGVFDLPVLDIRRLGLRVGTNQQTVLQRPVLMFEVKPSGSTKIQIRCGSIAGVLGNLSEDLAVANFSIGTGDNDDEQQRTMHQIIPPEPHFRNGNTTFGDVRIEFHVITGRARFTDAVLFYQRNVDTAAP